MGKCKEKLRKAKKIATINYEILSLHQYLGYYSYMLTSEQMDRIFDQIDGLEAQLEYLKNGEAYK